ncbi:hypothetical protein [Planctomicrobium sp. SH527]|uniref:hypothetical protein n=1 Tax=Planctomicrobium sp. SH527 TaxID=3448123 RepID=UPI003F5B7380
MFYWLNVMATVLKLGTLLFAVLVVHASDRGIRDANAHDESSHQPSDAAKGTFIELGDHEYRAEVILNEAESLLTFRLFDKTGKQAVVTDVLYAVINLKSGTTSKQYQLPALASNEGKQAPSTFQIQHKLLISSLHKHGTKAVFRVSIQNRSYAGKVSFDHHAH